MSERIERIIDSMIPDLTPNVTVGFRRDGNVFRASLVGVFANGRVIETPCRNTPEEAVEALYETVVEMAWKEFRPVQRKMRALGLTVPEPSVPNESDGVKGG